MKLSARLSIVASYINKGMVVADIGTDHALLPIYLIENEIAQKVYACDIVDGPINAAISNINDYGYQHQIKVLQGNGIAPAFEYQVDCITICGMGAALIKSILLAASDYLTNVQRVVCQPNINGHELRIWAIENGWQIIDETIIEENDKVYEIMAFEKGDMELSEDEILLGKINIKEHNHAFIKKWTFESKALEMLLKQIPIQNHEKRDQLTHKKLIIDRNLRGNKNEG